MAEHILRLLLGAIRTRRDAIMGEIRQWENPNDSAAIEVCRDMHHRAMIMNDAAIVVSDVIDEILVHESDNLQGGESNES